MSVGTYISAIGHIGLIGWVLVGLPSNTPEDDPLPETTEVSVISTEAFEIMLNNDAPDIGLLDAAMPAQPQEIDIAPALEATEDTPPDQTELSETDLSDPDVLPTARPAPLVRPDASAFATPLLPTAPPVDVTPSSPIEESLRPQPRPAPRVAPTAVAPPPPDMDIGDVTRDAVQPADEPAEESEPAETAEAPEAANTEIVTEAEAGTGAPATSLRPQRRPADLVATAEPEIITESADKDIVTAALEAALAEARREQELAEAATAQTLSVAEAQGLTLAIQDCWNVGFLSSEALSTTVVIGVEFTIDGRPDPSSIRLIARSGGSDSSARQAFIAARSAILECGQTGFELPQNIYDTWRSMELVFNPTKMRIK